MTGLWAKLVMSICGAFALVAADRAEAGTYTVRACWGSETGGWERIPAVSSSTVLWICPVERPPDSKGGVFAGAPQALAGSRVGWTFSAPAGTEIVGVTAEVAIGQWGAADPGTAWTRAIWNDETGSPLAYMSGGPTQWTLIGAPDGSFSARRIGLGMRCYTAFCEGPLYAGSRMWETTIARRISVTLRDASAPSLSARQAPPSSWLGNASFPIAFSADDNVGVKALAAFVDGQKVASTVADCFNDPLTNSVPRPCAGPAGELVTAIDASRLPDGQHTVTLRASDPVGNVTDRDHRILVDHVAPGAPRGLAVQGGTGWRSSHRFSFSWSNPPQAGGSPITAADFEWCPMRNAPYDSSGCRSGTRTGAELDRIDALEAPGDGAWRLRLSLRDGAGNSDPDRAATLEGLAVDSDRPDASFAALDPADPRRLVLNAGERTSAVAGGEIEVRRQGEEVWRALRVEAVRAGFTAIIDDEQLPDGRYDVRGRVVDVAGNERTTTTLEDGRALVVELPLRAQSALEVGRPVRVRVEGSKGRRPTYRRVLAGVTESRYGEVVRLEGRLVDPVGNARVNEPIDVSERVDLPGLEWKHAATLRSSASGGFTFRAAAGPARVLRFRYPGSSTARPIEDVVELRVRAGVTLKPSRTRVRNGEAVVFRGRLLGAPLPSNGKVLALQARTARGWRTFATPRARGKDGKWAHRYRFTGTPTTVRYRFRVVVPAEGSYPYARGTSRTAGVLVRGGE